MIWCVAACICALFLKLNWREDGTCFCCHHSCSIRSKGPLDLMWAALMALIFDLLLVTDAWIFVLTCTQRGGHVTNQLPKKKQQMIKVFDAVPDSRGTLACEPPKIIGQEQRCFDHKATYTLRNLILLLRYRIYRCVSHIMRENGEAWVLFQIFPLRGHKKTRFLCANKIAPEFHLF